MRISDIDVIRGDAQTQKPFVAFGADTTYDAPEPYGEEKKESVFHMEVTAEEKELLLRYLNEKRKECNQTLNYKNPKPKARERNLRRVCLIHGLMDKLKGGTNPQPTDTL